METDLKPELKTEEIGIADLLKVDFPPVSENVQKQISETLPKTAEAAELAGYNPAIHETPPRKNKRGEWAKKRGNKKGYDFQRKINLPPENIGEPKTENASENGAENGAPAPEKIPASSESETASGAAGLEISTAQAAKVCSGLFYFGLEKFSDYNAPEKERAAHEAACYDYLLSTGGVNMPPWGVLACVSAQSVLNACAQPKAKTRLGKIKDWFVLKLYAWKNRRRGNRMPQGEETATATETAGQ